MSPFSETRRHLAADLRQCSGGGEGPLIFLSHLFHPSFQLSLSYRLARFFYLSRLEFLAKFFTALGRLFCGSDVHYRAEIDGGVAFPHGRGIVVGEGVRVEKNCTIFHNSTLGAMEGREGYPVLREGVNIYPGTVVAGAVEIGEYSRIGPNVYLTDSLPSHTRAKPEKPQLKRKATDV